jgi:hypothetical protein
VAVWDIEGSLTLLDTARSVGGPPAARRQFVPVRVLDVANGSQISGGEPRLEPFHVLRKAFEQLSVLAIAARHSQNAAASGIGTRIGQVRLRDERFASMHVRKRRPDAIAKPLAQQLAAEETGDHLGFARRLNMKPGCGTVPDLNPRPVRPR